MRKPISVRPNPRGFALIVTLSLMILLTVIAVGLLSLSAVSLRSTSQGSAQMEAQANARMALLQAIGELQLELGPDRRINCPAGIDKEALPEHRNWLAVYDSWKSTEANRPEADAQFRRFLVSGDREALRARNAAKKALSGESIELVSTGTLGTGTGASAGRVKAGLVPINGPSNNLRGHYAWWISDDNSKAKVNAGVDIPTQVSADLLAQHTAQSAPGTGFALAEALSGVKGNGRKSWEFGDDLRTKSLGLGSLELVSGVSSTVLGSIHDLNTHAAGILADVRVGQLKRDLSLYLQQEFAPNDRARLRQPLYTVQNAATVNFTPDSSDRSNWDRLDEFSGITMEELWLYYNLYKEVSYNRPASTDFKVGTIPGNYPTLVSGNTRDDVIRDPSYLYKRHIYSQVKYILSLAAVPNATGKYDLRVAVDPVVILWNPNNVALEYQTGGFTTVGFSSLPYDCKFDVTTTSGTSSTLVPFSSFFDSVNGILAQVGKAQKIILRPGESRVLSIAADQASVGNGVTTDLQAGWDFTTGAIFNTATFPKGLAPSDRVRVTLQPRIQTASDDYITYWFGPRTPNPALQSGTISLQHDMQIGDELPLVTTQAFSLSNIAAEKKVPMMLFSYYLRPERDTLVQSKPWIWDNPAVTYRWPPDNSLASLLHRQFEMKVVALDTWENPYVQITPDNQAYWGGGVRADFGVPFFTFRSVPLTPPQSLASFQHACANGFRRYWKDSPISTGGLGTFPTNAYSLDGYQYLAPLASKVIGNSFSQPLIAKDQVKGQLFANLGAQNTDPPRNYATADHSYLANAALWDSWYFSSLGPQTAEPYASKRRDVQQVFNDFFPDKANVKSVPLPSARILPYRRSGDETGLRALVRNGKPDVTPNKEAYRKLAAYLKVDGAFNVNSTSVTAWKVILGSLRGHDTTRRDRTGNKSSLESASAGETPVNGLVIANGPRSEPSGNQQEPNQWTGFRTLSDEQIGKLATALVEEIRLRGPSLSLSDFINRRPGGNVDFARQGPLQAAIEQAGINGDLDKASRSEGTIAGAPFPEAGRGSRAAGTPGYISQADLLTALGPTLQARSDCFTIRAFGDATDRSGKVIARAWCEAVVQRVPEYLDSADEPDVQDLSLKSTVNRNFGRKFQILSFRWLNHKEV